VRGYGSTRPPSPLAPRRCICGFPTGRSKGVTVNRSDIDKAKIFGNVGVTEDQSFAKIVAAKPRSSRITLMLALAASTVRTIPSSK
jgi:hypothetical protein